MKYLLFFMIANFLNANILKEFDNTKLNTKEGRVDITITSIKNKVSREKQYSVYVKNDNSLVTFLHKKEKGTVVLNILNNLYIKVPSSRKTIRITPIQRLFGDASVGDILQLEFKRYYELIKEEEGVYTLKAKKRDSTYHKIVLFTKNNKLYNAKLFSYSKKLLKTVYYYYNNQNIIDKYKFVTKSSQSIVYIKKVKHMKLPNRLFKKSNIKKAFKNATSL
ncbi:MAG: outer membrane lipoprotein-sorting protein [Arcobacter sp.]|nr:outer membrane lipoprotein-sorting protein [Arcobacter sp.]